MRTLLVTLVTSVIFAGCAVDPAPEPEAQPADYGFIKDAKGDPVRTDVSALRFTPQQSFDRSTPTELVLGGAKTNDCSGVCTANSCSCSGDFECCVTGCRICMILVAD